MNVSGAMKKINVGDLVAFNELSDATWFEVLGIQGTLILVREYSTDYASQYSDTSLIRKIKKKS